MLRPAAIVVATLASSAAFAQMGVTGVGATAIMAGQAANAPADEPETKPDKKPSSRSTAAPTMGDSGPAKQDAPPLSPEDLDFKAAVEAVRNKEFRRAVDLFEPLADGDASDAQYNLALLLTLGRGRPQNFRDAYYWAVLSDLGDEQRAKSLVDELRDYLPEKQQDEIVKRLIGRLEGQIDQGNIAAPGKLARVYSEYAVKPDMGLAYVWFAICYAIGNTNCEEGMQASSADMPLEELIKVQIRASETFDASAYAKGTN